MSDTWNLSKAVEINLIEEDDFLVIKESLSRMGIGSWKNKTLYQTAHILHKRGRYYITHFKLMFSLDGKDVEFDKDDWKRQNRIAKILQEWGLCDIVQDIKDEDMVLPHQIKVLKHSDKDEWNLVKKYDL